MYREKPKNQNVKAVSLGFVFVQIKIYQNRGKLISELVMFEFGKIYNTNSMRSMRSHNRKLKAAFIR